MKGTGFHRRVRAALAPAFALLVLALPTSAAARDYIVFVDDAVDPSSVARSVGARTELQFSEVASGFSADLTDAQFARLSSDSRVVDIHEDQPFALAQFGTEDYETGDYGTNAFKRGAFSDDAFKRGAFDGDAFKRGSFEWDAFKRGAFKRGAFKRGAFDAEAFKRGAFKRGAFKRGAFKRGAFKRGAKGTPFVSQFVPTGIDRIGANGWVNGDVNADIAILDSGIARHVDLNVAYAGSCIPDEDGRDRSGHGTMVAGLAAARDNRYGVVGSAPGARIWSIKVADQTGTIMESAALCGLEFVLNNSRSLEVANMSWSGRTDTVGESCTNLVAPSPQRTRNWRARSWSNRGRWPWRRDPGVTPPNAQPSSGAPGDEVDPASIDVLHGVLCGITEQNVTVVAAAGNDAEDASLVLPAAWPEVIAVSSLSDSDGRPGGRGPAGCMTGDADDTFSSFSNFGPVVAIAAPGECQLSTDVDGGYSYGSGTSFAAPLVAGVAAVHASRDRGATPASIREKLLATAEPGPIAGDPDEYGEGLLRAKR